MAIAAFPLTLQSFSHGLPFGLVSFLAAYGIATLFWLWLDVVMHFGSGGTAGQGFKTGIMALVLALTVTVAQTLVMRDNNPGLFLQALMLGFMAGMAAPLTGMGIRALFNANRGGKP